MRLELTCNGPFAIIRRWPQLTVTIYSRKTGIYAEIDRVMDGLELPRGYSWDKGESYGDLQEEDNTMLFAGIMAITCVFLLMGVLFESFILPFSVLLSIPFALWGVYWTLHNSYLFPSSLYCCLLGF